MGTFAHRGYTISDKANNVSIGVLGGMFDPVHKGHLDTALSALNEFDFDELRLIPCGKPVHRDSSIASDKDRIAMLKLAVGTETRLLVDERECKKTEPSYTIATLESLKQDYPQAQLFLLMGVDAFNSLTTWQRWQALFNLCHLIVIARPGWELESSNELAEFTQGRMVSTISALKSYGQGKVLTHSFVPVKAGSTEVRGLIKDKKPVQHLLPKAVWSYIETHQLYA